MFSSKEIRPPGQEPRPPTRLAQKGLCSYQPRRTAPQTQTAASPHNKEPQSKPERYATNGQPLRSFRARFLRCVAVDSFFVEPASLPQHALVKRIRQRKQGFTDQIEKEPRRH